MESAIVKEFYNQDLQASAEPYEQRRWFNSAQSKVGYDATNYAVQKYALPTLRDNMTVLELGPGPGTWTKLLLQKAPQASYDLVDISKEMLSQAQAALAEYTNISYTESDICEFTPERQYDYFFSSRIIEYVPDKDKAIATIARSLKTGANGFLITKTPQYKRLFFKKPKAGLHSLQIDCKKISDLLEKHGCEVTAVLPVTFVFPKLKSAFLDRLVFNIGKFLPLYVVKPFTESYAVAFVKK